MGTPRRPHCAAHKEALKMSITNGHGRSARSRRPLAADEPPKRRIRAPRSIAALLLALAGLAAGTANATADGTKTLPGGPLIVSVGSLGECQSSYANVGVNFYPPSGTLGDCGFFLAFPSTQTGALKESVYGFSGSAGPHITGAEKNGREYTAIEQGEPTGSGTAADPYTEVTKFKVSYEGKDFAIVTVTTQYVNGQAQYTATYDVQNITGSGGTAESSTPLLFHAIVAGDLFVANDDHGTGVFGGVPPRFIGGQNPHTGTLGGFIEVPTSPWSNWQEGYWDGPFTVEGALAEDHGIWNAVRISDQSTGPVFNNTIDPALIDNGAGASWDNHLSNANSLEPGAHAVYTIIGRAQVPTTLGVQPVSQTLTVGQTGNVTVTATDNVGTPYAGRNIVYTIGGANPKSGTVTTNSAGQATISYVGSTPGIDTIQMFLDLAGTGAQAAQDPASAAQITWTPPLPNSSYKVQSIKANADGTITITFVPAQAGAAVVVVTVPTASIAKRAKCKKGQARIKGKCRPINTLSGRATAKGVAGVPLKITIKPSSKVKKLLKKGKTVVLTATLTYTSALGGKPMVHTFRVKVKGKRHR
jgi:hypothetical protein